MRRENRKGEEWTREEGVEKRRKEEVPRRWKRKIGSFTV